MKNLMASRLVSIGMCTLGIILVAVLSGPGMLVAVGSTQSFSTSIFPLAMAPDRLGAPEMKASGTFSIVMVGQGGLRPSPTQAFRIAYKDYLRGQYDLAIISFQQFLKDYPTSSLVPQAYFYMGEAYDNTQDLVSASNILHKLVRDFPKSRFVPSALFKLGKIVLRRGDPQKAKQFWSQVIKDFPRSPEARLARQAMVKHGMKLNGTTP